MSAQQTYRDRVAAYFKDRPHVWIDGISLEPVGGKYAWRSRVSDCRRELGMTIENRQRREWDAFTGEWFTISEYCYVPSVESGEHTNDDDVTRIGELAVDPSPQHASADEAAS